MRYLNKIIFIASANINYAEIKVDGNVHFIGTQGVGKSTILRALLFFYNANVQKLGIPNTKKSFADFYLPYQNSYIIYEVVKETGAFCVLAFRSSGRVCFRFFDGEYKKKYFVGEDNAVLDSWDKIKLSINQQVAYSKKIERYEDYRNILYGNSQGMEARFKKYAILESKQYQNIPRAIQHVFLNYKVESDFIKDTIIKALHEVEIKIEMAKYSHHLKDFDIQLTDIRKWSEQNKTGEFVIVKLAQQIIDKYATLEFVKQEKQRLLGELAWQHANTKAQQPLIAQQLTATQQQLQTQQTKLNNLEKLFKGKELASNKEITIYMDKLKTAKQKTEFYQSKNISEIISISSNKANLELEKNSLTNQKNLLETNFGDIKYKYQQQISLLENQLASYIISQNNNINTANNDCFEHSQQVIKQYGKLIKQIHSQHSEELQLANKAVAENKLALDELNLQQIKIEHSNFCTAELDKLNSNIATSVDIIRDCTSQISSLENQQQTFKQQGLIEQERLQEQHANQAAMEQQNIAQLQTQINAIAQKIAASKDSLYGWLNTNYANWQDTIGKVIDEESILFNKNLMPKKNASKDLSLYGIELDLAEIEVKVKTVADYKKDIDTLQVKVNSFQKKLLKLTEQGQLELDNLKRKYQAKSQKCKDAIANAQYNLEQNQRKLKQYKIDLQTTIEQAAAQKDLELSRIHSKMSQLGKEKVSVQNNLSVINTSLQNKIKLKQKEQNLQIKLAEQQLASTKAEIAKHIQAKQIQINDSIKQLNDQQTSELLSKGADTKQIAMLQQQLNSINAELDYIEKHNSLLIEYQYDKRELFDRVEEFKQQKALAEKALANATVEHQQQQQKLQAQLASIQVEQNKLCKLSNDIAENLLEFTQFIADEAFISLNELLQEADITYQTDDSCKDIIAELKKTYYANIERCNQLQQLINKFTGNFSEQNIFKFKTNLIELNDYFQFSAELKEFINEDKITLFSNRVNELFADIVKQLSNETTGLLSKEGEIQTVISAINKDFMQRNFAGVIKSIELRTVASGNKIVQHLAEIKKFNDEHIHDLGEANLFSTGKQERDNNNKKAVALLASLVKEINNSKADEISLSDSFELEFKIIENDNDTNWVQNLANVGSDGTDVLVKAMINIMLLNVFKEGATKNRFKDFRLHCMMDEIGKLHPENVRGILKFANDRNIYLINSSPQSFDALAYRYTYKLAKDDQSVTIINRLITNNQGLA